MRFHWLLPCTDFCEILCQTRKTAAQYIRDGYVFSAGSLGCVSGCENTLLDSPSRARQAGRRGLYPSCPPLMVLSPCGCCGVAHVFITVSSLDCDHTTVRLLSAAPSRRQDRGSDYWMDAFCLTHGAPRVCSL